MARNSFAIAVGNEAPKKITRSIKWRVLEQRRSYPHLQRKLYHVANGLFCFALYTFFLSDSQALWVLGTVGGVWFVIDALRFYSPRVNQAALRVFGRLMRREELKSLTGNSYFILGLLAVAAIFPRPIVCLSVLYLALGDPIAAMVGTRWGKNRIFGKKSLEGAIANFVVCATVSFLFGTFIFSTPQRFWLAVIGGLAAVIAELLPLKIDDNFTIPVASATILWCVSQFLPLFG